MTNLDLVSMFDSVVEPNLESMLELQRRFNESINGIPSDDTERQAMTKEYILHLISECDELLNSINWKMHRVHDKVVSRSKLKEEWIDLFKYVLSIGLVWGFDHSDLVSEFYRKSAVVKVRYHQEKELDLIKDENVIGCDIDGVVSDYPASYYNFIYDNTGVRIVSDGSYDIYDNVASVLGYDTAIELKRMYRESGQKRFIEPLPLSSEVLSELKSTGYTIVMLSSRPVNEYPRIFSDTIENFLTYKIPYDAIMFSEKKEDEVIRRFSKMKFMIEDNANNALKVARRGYLVYLMDQPYNANVKHKNIVRVLNWKEILYYVRQRHSVSTSVTVQKSVGPSV